MKKFLAASLTAILLGAGALNCRAQSDYKNEFALDYSQFTLTQTAYVLGGVLGVAFSLGHFTMDNPLFLGAIGLEYTHYVNDWFGFGGVLTFDYMTADACSVDSDGVKTKTGTFNLGYASLMPIVKFRWFNRHAFGMYSKLGAGGAVGFSSGGESPAGFGVSAQVSPVCFEFGGGSVRGLVELGYGMQGIVTVGIKKQF